MTDEQHEGWMKVVIGLAVVAVVGVACVVTHTAEPLMLLFILMFLLF